MIATASTLARYRETLEQVRGGTVPAELALEILDAAEQEIAHAHGEYTLAQAMAMSGRSRSWFERRLPDFEARGLARRAGRVWLLKRAAIPERATFDRDGFDPGVSDEDILRRLRERDQAA